MATASEMPRSGPPQNHGERDYSSPANGSAPDDEPFPEFSTVQVYYDNELYSLKGLFVPYTVLMFVVIHLSFVYGYSAHEVVCFQMVVHILSAVISFFAATRSRLGIGIDYRKLMGSGSVAIIMGGLFSVTASLAAVYQVTTTLPAIRLTAVAWSAVATIFYFVVLRRSGFLPKLSIGVAGLCLAGVCLYLHLIGYGAVIPTVLLASLLITLRAAQDSTCMLMGHNDSWTLSHLYRIIGAVVCSIGLVYMLWLSPEQWELHEGWLITGVCKNWLSLTALWIAAVCQFGVEQHYLIIASQSTPLTTVHALTLAQQAVGLVVGLAFAGNTFSWDPATPPAIEPTAVTLASPATVASVPTLVAAPVVTIPLLGAVPTTSLIGFAIVLAASYLVIRLSHVARDWMLAQGVKPIPFYMKTWMSVLTAARLLTAYAVAALARFITAIAGLIAPPGLRFFTFAEPVPDVEGILVGTAYMAVPATPADPPGVYHCNIGHMDTIDDFVETNRMSYEMLRELSADPDGAQKGFCGDLVCEIPEYRDNAWYRPAPLKYRQVNLSAWRDQKAAHDWYIKSAHHKAIVNKYYRRQLSSFSASLAHLEPSKPVRYHVRCPSCRTMLKKYPDETECGYCGNTDIPRMPFF